MTAVPPAAAPTNATDRRDREPLAGELAPPGALAAALRPGTAAAEGGLFRRTFTGDGATAIYFMLIGDDFSALHRLAADEIYCHHAGAPLRMLLIDPAGGAREVLIGPDALAGQHPQFIVPAGCWQGVVERRVLEPGVHRGGAGIRLAATSRWATVPNSTG